VEFQRRDRVSGAQAIVFICENLDQQPAEMPANQKSINDILIIVIN
jgi:hypothetical protein